jgi:hypothetical protein
MTGFASKRAMARSLQDDILDQMGKDMAREIDKDLLDIIMIDVLTKDEGWIATKVNPAFTDIGMNIVPSRFDDWYSQTAEWIHLNAQGDYKLLKGQWLFKDPKDATMFILKWT